MKYFLVAFGCLAFASPALFAQGGDKIFIMNQDKPQTGTIEDESLSEVTLKQGAATTKFSWDKVARIEYGPGNTAFIKVTDAMAKGEYAVAVGLLEPLKPEREIFAPRRLYLLGTALAGQGNLKGAEDKYNELVSKHEKNYYTRQAIRSLVEVQIKNKNFAAAASSAEKGMQIAQGVKNTGLALEFRYIKATVLEAQDKFPEAESEFKAVSAAAGADAKRVARLADIGQARIASRTPDMAKVKTLIEAILKDNDPALLPGAYAAMGDALLNQGIKESNGDRLREAANEYFLRVVVQFPPPSNESQDDLERALFGYAKACKQLSLPSMSKQKEEADYWKQELTKTIKEFNERFAGSRYAARVAELR